MEAALTTVQLLQTYVEIKLEHDEVTDCLTVPQDISESELLQQANAKFGQKYDSVDYESEPLVGKEGHVFKFENGARLKLSTKTKVSNNLCRHC